MSFLDDYVISEGDDLLAAAWLLGRSQAILAVLGADGKYVGALAQKNLAAVDELAPAEAAEVKAGQVCDRRYPTIVHDDRDVYAAVRSLMADRVELQYVPILDGQGRLLDIFSRRRAFYRDYFKRFDLPRMHYAYILDKAALEAGNLGLKHLSMLEFGVATGNGLVACEFHARELGRHYGLDIEVYGFDTGRGLPEPEDDYKDVMHLWRPGLFKMNYERLKSRLRSAKLVIGDLAETAPRFLEEHQPAPIGAAVIDVDYYSSTVPILEMFTGDDRFFLPRIQLYFDDILNTHEFSGETLAVKEFNARHENLKISPEGCSVGRPEHRLPNLKICHRLRHPLYGRQILEYAPYGLKPLV